jgi:hypothetical protein
MSAEFNVRRQTSMIPTENKMPQLYPELGRLQPQLMLTAAFIGNGTLSQNAALMRREVVRLIDKAIYEYTLAQQAIIDQIAETHRPYEELVKGRIIYMIGFTDHMENCINATRRLVALLQNLRSDRSAPLQDKIKRRLVEAHANPLIDIRDTLEHMGEIISEDKMPDGHPVVIALGDDQASIQLGAYSLSFQSLSIILRALHSEAVILLAQPHAISAA